MLPTTVFAKKHVAIVRSSEFGDRKIFSVSFEKDNTVFVHLPYFSISDGILFRCVGRYANGHASIEGIEIPHTVSHHVKFSYHPDGRMHFSQDSKVRTVVVGALPSQRIHSGVLFQVWAYGFNEYAHLQPKDSKQSVAKMLTDCTPTPESSGVIITGYISKPGVSAVESSGQPRLISRSPNSPFLIALGYKTLQAPLNFNGAYLLFSAGPSAPTIIAPGGLRSVLTAIYPRDAAEALFPNALSADFEIGSSANTAL